MSIKKQIFERVFVSFISIAIFIASAYGAGYMGNVNDVNSNWWLLHCLIGFIFLIVSIVSLVSSIGIWFIGWGAGKDDNED